MAVHSFKHLQISSFLHNFLIVLKINAPKEMTKQEITNILPSIESFFLKYVVTIQVDTTMPS